MNNGWMSRVKLRFEDLFYGISFKQRIRITFIILIILAIGVVGTSSYWIASKELQKNAFASSQENVDKTAQIMDDKLNSIAVTVRSLMFSDAFKQMMKDVESSNIANYYVHLSEFQYVFSQLSYNDPLIEHILIATPIGDFYSTSQRRSQTQSFYESSLYYEMKDIEGGLWEKGHTDKLFTGDKRVLSYVTRGTQDTFTNPKVFIVVNINETGLIGLLNKHSSRNDNNFFVVDAKGEEVIRTSWSSGHSLVRDELFLNSTSNHNQGSFFHTFDQTEYLVNFTRSAMVKDWRLFGIQPKDKLLEQMNGVQRTTVYIMLVFLFTSWLLSNRLTALLLKPLFKLQRLMREVEDTKLSVRFQSRYHDEVAQVGFQFNRMLDEINRLIDDVRTSEAGKRQAEMRALTAQMEPHFLYNTLNTIYCKSMMGENNDVNEMILALSHMFQLGLSGGKDWNTLEDELSHVQQYCAIQQKCYEGLFEYHMKVSDDRLLSCIVPKILLQPIIENSIQHGFNNRRSGGTIDLQVLQEQGKLHIIIQDNGVGMNMDSIQQSMVHQTTSKKGYALYNIVNRLHLYYGEAASIEMFGSPGGGSRTDLWIPLRNGEGGTYG
ncbi:sensor histidine kinase [Paenibacillus rigui]|uniref:Two-component sensor histidine kinase n=1 Tax=Paenibacillus rigui TaxID=554312 RepID=A0A229UJJ3_9BACL|nr:sensor histidine kinase [Paenibacillus rigui]OXM83069.1 two-component sensor histidine kinase [Paenibacillus rigui]